MRHKALLATLLKNAQKPHIFGLVFILVALLTCSAFFALALLPQREKPSSVLGSMNSTPTTTPSVTNTPTITKNTISSIKPTTTTKIPTPSPTKLITTPTLTPTNTPQPIPSATPQPLSGPVPELGESSAKITIIEYSDFQCLFCKDFVNGAFLQIKSDYVSTGKVKLSYRHFPLTSHANAPKASEASECANDQGKFWGFHDYLFEKQDAWASKSTGDIVTLFTDYAIQKGMNADQFKSCLESGKYKMRVEDHIMDGKNRGVTGTPTFLINDRVLIGAQSFEAFKTIIDEELAK